MADRHPLTTDQALNGFRSLDGMAVEYEHAAAVAQDVGGVSTRALTPLLKEAQRRRTMALEALERAVTAYRQEHGL